MCISAATSSQSNTSSVSNHLFTLQTESGTRPNMKNDIMVADIFIVTATVSKHQRLDFRAFSASSIRRPALAGAIPTLALTSSRKWWRAQGVEDRRLPVCWRFELGHVHVVWGEVAVFELIWSAALSGNRPPTWQNTVQGLTNPFVHVSPKSPFLARRQIPEVLDHSCLGLGSL